MRKWIRIAALLVWAGSSLAVAQTNPAFAPCAACHSVKRGEKRLGPDLAGIVGRKKASVPGFAYSPALKRQAGSWTEADLAAYIANPRAAIPGTRMMFAGVTDPAKRAALIRYLKSVK